MTDQVAVHPLPWHASALNALPTRQRLHHGILLTGLSGVGKREFAMALARRLLCLDPSPSECGERCQSCQLFSAGTHPDLHILCTEWETAQRRLPLIGEYSNRYQDVAARERRTNPSRVIPVDQVRTLIERLTQSSHISVARVAVLVDAGRMNINAANALLKLLEEPPGDSYLLLVTARPETLPATVRSRCLVTALPQPDIEQCRAWLTAHAVSESVGSEMESVLPSGGVGPLDLLRDMNSGAYQTNRENALSVLGVLSGAEDPVVVAGALAKQDGARLLEWLQLVIADLIRHRVSLGQGRAVSGLNLERAAGGSRLSVPGLYAQYDKIGRYRSMAADQLNLQLALEDVMIGFSGAR